MTHPFKTFQTFGLAAGLLFSAAPAAVLLPAAPAVAQQRQAITLEDLWVKGTFAARSVQGFNWMRDGRYYSALEKGEVVQHDVTTGQATQTLVASQQLKPVGSDQPISVDGYEFNADEQKMLFSTATEPIYRRSTRANYFVYDRAAQKLVPLSTGGKQSYATFSPDGRRVAFMRQNNMYVVDLQTMQETPITTDGQINKLIHGGGDWVYEEEFEVSRAFKWSPDSKQLAYISFDESRVPEYNLQEWGPLYPKDYRYKYPKAGEPNSIVTVSVYDVEGKRTTKMDIGSETDQYIPRIEWTKTPGLLSIQRTNRLQNKLELLHGNTATGKTEVVWTDTDKAYVDVTDDLRYLKNGKQFVVTSERDGYRHIYLFDMKGKLVKQLTQGAWEVSEFVGVDEAKGQAYYLSAEASPLQRHLYRVDLKGKNKTRLGEAGNGTDVVNMSPDFRYYLNYHSAANEPQTVSLRNGQDGKLVKVLEDNAKLKQRMQEYGFVPQETFSFKTSEGVTLNGCTIKPANMEAGKKYPVLTFLYGGPGSQKVLDKWNSVDYYTWFQMLAQQGYVVAIVDNRGTGGRGAEFKKCTYAQMGKLETIDQGEAVKYLGAQPWADKGRIGIFGWSYGGYLAALAMTKNADLYKAGISVAPVTNWRYYDTIYSERYLKTPQDNAAGYDDNSPVQFANLLKGKYLLVHGTGDDNVHFQNSVAFTDALVKANKDFEQLYYPNRNHGIYGGNTRLHLFRQMTNFLLQNL
ncbi:S9 family peptidase [Hymenobacter jeollabukensis]|uniref:S9 family peptidase n=1 Tax=Hymenobacter jeollabukensis TaxID=2025313 RepID=A0A5R8WU09_9BACT|nr:S9 family peptidase [Hymenobacter jeollabukensis]TLM95249.1 S9 family peptidase [Hymenobacter jeollabukensis]